MVGKSSSSLPIPVANVQELAASCFCCCDDDDDDDDDDDEDQSSSIPQRYIRTEAEADLVGNSKDDMHIDLPVIDWSRLLDPRLCQEESVKLNHACENWGFFQLINHGVSEELMEKMKAVVSGFFKLPLEQKQAYAIRADGGPEGYGQHFVVSEEQKLDWADLMYIVTQPPASRNMALWPACPPNFRDTLDEYSFQLQQVTVRLLGLMGRNLGCGPEIVLNKFKDHWQSVRINYYPPCPKASKALGLSPHTDPGALTLLLQLSDVQGLQIKNNGKWFPVDILPGAFIVNIGDVLEILSNGKYKSVEHRAVVNTERERLSIGTFSMPEGGCTVGPLPQLVKGGDREKYKNVTCENYLKAYLAAKLDGKSLLESMKL